MIHKDLIEALKLIEANVQSLQHGSLADKCNFHTALEASLHLCDCYMGAFPSSQAEKYRETIAQILEEHR